eukprot:2792901-Prymnesium_polylepis.2
MWQVVRAVATNARPGKALVGLAGALAFQIENPLLPLHNSAVDRKQLIWGPLLAMDHEDVCAIEISRRLLCCMGFLLLRGVV